MKVSKAIGILQDHADALTIDFAIDTRDAVVLGIEALKFWKDLLDRGALPSNTRLSGETPEDK